MSVFFRNNDENKKRIPATIQEEEPESPQFREIQERRRKSALYTSIGSRKNLLELAGTTNHILNTPQKPDTSMMPLSILDPAKLTQEFDPSTLKPFKNSHSLSPSSKYGLSAAGGETETPTPPLKMNQFVRNAYRPRRKFSMLRDKFEAQEMPKGKPMIVAKNKNDLYENISNDFLMLRSNSLRAKAERMAKCKSVPTFNSDLLLRPDEQYTDGFMRNQWSTASYQKAELPNRQCNSRRSMSILDDKENFNPVHHQYHQEAPPLRPKMKSRLSNGASLSPRSKIFNSNRC